VRVFMLLASDSDQHVGRPVGAW